MKNFLLLLFLTQHIIYCSEITKPFKAPYASSATGLGLLTPRELLFSKIILSAAKSSGRYICKEIAYNTSYANIPNTNDSGSQTILNTLKEAEKIGPAFSDMVQYSFTQPSVSNLVSDLRTKKERLLASQLRRFWFGTPRLSNLSAF